MWLQTEYGSGRRVGEINIQVIENRDQKTSAGRRTKTAACCASGFEV
jgi:hypothetical protein